MLHLLSYAKPSIRSVALLGAALLLAGCANRDERIERIRRKADDALFADRVELAREILSKGIERFPDSNDIRLDMGQVLLDSGELAEAADLFDTIAQQDPERSSLWVQVAELRSQLGQSAEAIEAFQNYLENHDADFLAWKALAAEHEKTENLVAAIQAATRWHELAPSGPPALSIGQLYLKANNIPQARSWLAQAAAYLDGEAPKLAIAALTELETSLMQLPQAEEWMKNYEQRYGLDDPDPRIAEARITIEHWHRAREEIAQAAAKIERDRLGLEALQTPATVGLSDIDIASAPTEASPGDVAAEQTGSSWESPTEREPEPLFGSEETAAATSPELAESATLAEARQAYARQDYQGAINLYWQLLGEGFDDAELWGQLAQSYFAQRSWPDAEACALEAMRRAPESEEIAELYLRAARRIQSPERVLEEIAEQRRRFPQSAAIALLQAQARRDANSSPSAITSAYRDFLGLAAPSDPGYQEAQRYLQGEN